MARKVLVVDDEKLIVKGIRFSLEQDGMEVDCAYDGEEAVKKAKETEYDVVLLDAVSYTHLLAGKTPPETRWVEGSNYVDINYVVDPRTNRVVMMGALDNLIKGAAGQAVQNMNLLFGFEETEGLMQVPMFP